jgi:hypothetical protein
MKKGERRRIFTTTLPNSVLLELDHAAKELGLRKNDILIQAFIDWNTERKKVS